MGAWKPLIRSWLIGDRTASRKQRHTVRRIWRVPPRRARRGGRRVAGGRGATAVTADRSERRGQMSLLVASGAGPRRV